MKTYALSILAFSVAFTLVGCNQRGADDRITLSEEQRQENHGPGYTVVALRQVDRARLSNSGVVIINDHGLEPVYVSDVAYTRHTSEEIRDNIKDLEALNSRLQALQNTLHQSASVTPSAPVTPSTKVERESLPLTPVLIEAPLIESAEKPTSESQRTPITDGSGNPVKTTQGTVITTGPLP